MNSISDSWLICFAEEFGLNHRGTETQRAKSERWNRGLRGFARMKSKRLFFASFAAWGLKMVRVDWGFGEGWESGRRFNMLLLLGALDRLFALG
jgi:hypothetical protein